MDVLCQKKLWLNEEHIKLMIIAQMLYFFLAYKNREFNLIKISCHLFLGQISYPLMFFFVEVLKLQLPEVSEPNLDLKNPAFLTKHMKPKKLHEIEHLGKVVFYHKHLLIMSIL